MCALLFDSFYSASLIDLKNPFTYKDLEKLPEKYPILRILKGRYNLDDILNLDESAVPYGAYSEKDPTGIRSIKKWVKLDRIKHPGTKEVTWENLLWLLNECKADPEMIKNFVAYITSIPKQDDTEPMETEADGESQDCGEVV